MSLMRDIKTRNTRLANLDSSTGIHKINKSVKDSKTNQLEISNVSNSIVIKNKYMLKEPHVFKDYRDLLFGFTDTIELDEKYYFRPEWFSLQLYGSVDFWYVILWLNDMTSVHDFKVKKIKVLNGTGIRTLLRILSSHQPNLRYDKENPLIADSNLVLKRIVE